MTVTAEPGVFPDGAALIVSDPNDGVSFKKAYAALADDATQAAAEAETIVASYEYEITVTDAEGNPVQVTSDNMADVLGDGNVKYEFTSEADGGTMQYSTDGKTWSTTVPTATNAGTYTVYYRVKGDANHDDTAARSLKVTIATKPEDATKPDPVKPDPVNPEPAHRPIYPDATLLAEFKTSGKTALTINWTKVADAQGYDVFFRNCDGKGNYPLRQTVYGGTITSYTIEGLKKGKCYKGYIKAWKMVNGTKAYIGTASPTVSAKGVVKGVKKGTVTIIATTANGLTAQTKVKVK